LGYRGSHILLYLGYFNGQDGKRVALLKNALQAVKKLKPQTDWGQADRDIEEQAKRHNSFLKKLGEWISFSKKAVNEQVGLVLNNSNILEEWVLKASNNSVRISPKNSQVQNFTNHELKVTEKPELEEGETAEYEWKTAGKYGTLKKGTAEALQFKGPETSIIYYGNDKAVNEDNIETVIVTLYAKKGTTTRAVSSDTATINVKKLKLIMKPDGASLTPSKGAASSSLKIELFYADGTNPVVNGAALQTKVVWATPGKYGGFNGGSAKEYTTSVNNLIYTATDKDVKAAVENITAKMYIKLASGVDWIETQNANATVQIKNEEDKKHITCRLQRPIGIQPLPKCTPVVLKHNIYVKSRWLS